ncbi:hypothetical protein EVAR_95152_1 [Eumeta japonica]|uniref:Uncharacterized protein n=1 Tax=Eumeta variegata TaxID=151549 RepID=A0A4C1W7D4_EUMVA|nr:hypothetical protein EVAR_95152_1 [Eumeta japonica]
MNESEGISIPFTGPQKQRLLHKKNNDRKNKTLKPHNIRSFNRIKIQEKTYSRSKAAPRGGRRINKRRPPPPRAPAPARRRWASRDFSGFSYRTTAAVARNADGRLIKKNTSPIYDDVCDANDPLSRGSDASTPRWRVSGCARPCVHVECSAVREPAPTAARPGRRGSAARRGCTFTTRGTTEYFVKKILDDAIIKLTQKLQSLYRTRPPSTSCRNVERAPARPTAAPRRPHPRYLPSLMRLNDNFAGYHHSMQPVFAKILIFRDLR